VANDDTTRPSHHINTALEITGVLVLINSLLASGITRLDGQPKHGRHILSRFIPYTLIRTFSILFVHGVLYVGRSPRLVSRLQVRPVTTDN